MNEYILHFTASPDSYINNCSGIMNVATPPFGSAMYLGGENMITGDQDDVSACDGGRYGTITPPA